MNTYANIYIYENRNKAINVDGRPSPNSKFYKLLAFKEFYKGYIILT